MKYVSVWIFFLCVFLFTLISLYKITTTSTPDFSIFYFAARDVLHGISPYTDSHLFTAFNYPLITAVLFLPFALLPLFLSQTIFTLLNFLSIFMAVFLCFFLLQKRFSIIPYLLFVSFALVSFPTKFTFGMGQVNLLANVFLLGSFLAMQKNKTFLTIFLFLLSIFLKPILGVALFVVLFEKKWKIFFSLCAIGILLLLLIPLLESQPQTNQLFLSQLIHQSFSGREVYYNQGFLGFISRLTPNLHLRQQAEIIGSIFFLGTCFFLFSKSKTCRKTGITPDNTCHH